MARILGIGKEVKVDDDESVAGYTTITLKIDLPPPQRKEKPKDNKEEKRGG